MTTTLKKTRGLYDEFPRKGGTALKATHYCAGCGHGILHKLIGEALADLGLQDRAIFISPVGCAVFGYYYFDCGNIQAAHGRAAAIGTALDRSNPEAVIVSYQGDGDLASIGFNQTFQAANRGDHMVIFFINNAVYGMTGGQLAPTSLPGQKTITSPEGRDVALTGYPIHVCEVLNTLKAPVYIERCSLADTPRILKARRAIRHALEIQRDRKGFAIVEFLSPCPTNFHKDALGAAEFVKNEMEKEFPLGCLRDRIDEVQPAPVSDRKFPTPAEFFGSTAGAKGAGQGPQPDPSFPELRIKISGFGGQGILRLGLLIAEAAQKAGRFVSWFPSYGPEQRGGTASCSVVISGQPIGTPVVAQADVLIALNQAALERFAPDVKDNGVLFYDASIPTAAPAAADAHGVRRIALPALEIANRAGSPLAANTAMLAGLAALNACGLPRQALADAMEAGFRSKPDLLALNRRVLDEAASWCTQTLTTTAAPANA